jgi:hypothetical protein
MRNSDSVHAALSAEIMRLAKQSVYLKRWDDYILGKTERIDHSVMSAGEAARIELDRWQSGRFPVIHLAIADAVFSKQKIYATAVKNAVEPFARAWCKTEFSTFCATPWTTIFERTFRREPAKPNASSHHHLSTEGRVRSILAASQKLLGIGVGHVTEAREVLATTSGRERIERTLLSAKGLGDALAANACMNLGCLQVKLDTHVREVLHQVCGVAKDAPTAQLLQYLEAAATRTGLHLFEIDQIIWYARAESA